MKISINCPSYKRPKVETLDYIKSCKIWVDGKEYEEYKKEAPLAEIIKCPDGIQGNVCRIRNYILDQEFKTHDVVVLVDDDMKGLFLWEGKESRLIREEDLYRIIEKYSLMAMELGAHMWGVNCVQDKKAYREYTPFSTRVFVGGPFQAFVKDAGGLRYDEDLPLKEDYDMTLQQLYRYRCVLRVNHLFYNVKQSVQAGGCASYRNFTREREQFMKLQKKRGSRIIQRDRSSAREGSGIIDYNPIMRVPIKGV
jgi:hypothetical protein